MPPRERKPDESRLPDRLRPRKVPSQERSRALVEALVEAGERLIVERGWDGLTMKDVGERAGAAAGSLFQYFPDKASLVAEIVERQSRRELAFQLEHMAHAPAGDLIAVLDHVVRGVLAFQASEGPLMRATLSAMPHLGRHFALVDRVERVTLAFRGLLSVHLPDVPPREIELATHVLVNAVHSLTHDGVLARPDWLDDD